MILRKIFVGLIVMTTGCASAPKLPQIPGGESVAIVVTANAAASGKADLKNDAVGGDVKKGAGVGAVGYGLWGLTCGPLAILCVPIAATVGAVGGAAAGAVVSTGGSLSAEQASQLTERMQRLSESRDTLDELSTNINDRAARYWDLNSAEPKTTVTVELQNLVLASTHGDQVRAILRVAVTVTDKTTKASRKGKPPLRKEYEYAGPYASLDVWLDEGSDFADTSITSAIQQISSQVVSDLIKY